RSGRLPGRSLGRAGDLRIDNARAAMSHGRPRLLSVLHKFVVGELVLALLVVLGLTHESAHHMAVGAVAELLVAAALQLIAVLLAALRALVEKVIGSPGHASVSSFSFWISARRASRAAMASARVFFGRAFTVSRHRSSQARSASSPSSVRGNSCVSSILLSRR